MKIEYSCGAVVFTRIDGQIRYVIIESLEGFYGFPKGHMEHGEDEKTTALREVLEETGLQVQLLDCWQFVDRHPIPSKPGITKQITYFLAEYHNQQVSYQPAELRSARLMSYEDAMNAFQFESTQAILSQAHDFLCK